MLLFSFSFVALSIPTGLRGCLQNFIYQTPSKKKFQVHLQIISRQLSKETKCTSMSFYSEAFDFVSS